MTLRTHSAWLLVLALAALCSLRAAAATDTKVEAPNEASALLVSDHSERPDTAKTADSAKETLKSFDQLADELRADTLDPQAALPGLPLDTAAARRLRDSLTAVATPAAPDTLSRAWRVAHFRPKPARALWLALVFPGAGQIYNRKYWKLPIFYGGFIGCTYALMWNQMMYRDYSQAYLDIMDDDPNTKSYMDMLPPRYDITGREEQFKTIFKRKKDRYRRYRDLSAFCFVGVYLLSVIDAYVDAQLSEFDISPDLSMRVGPSVIQSPSLLGAHGGQSAYGVGCSFKF